MEYQFSNNWFSTAKGLWDQLIPQIRPKRVLEIGSYEGASTVYLIEYLGRQLGGEVHCIDTWGGGIEHLPSGFVAADMGLVEERFHHNVGLALSAVQNDVRMVIHKGVSSLKLAELYATGKASEFDFVYVDGSHQAPDVICDAILGFKLLRVGGVMAFDDYLWSEPLPGGPDPIRCPKPAIDAFTNLYCRKLNVISAPLYQLYIRKTSE